MEWRPAGWSVCLPMLISPCTIKSRSCLLAPAHAGGPGKMAVNGCGGGCGVVLLLHCCVCQCRVLASDRAGAKGIASLPSGSMRKDDFVYIGVNALSFSALMLIVG